MFSDRYVSIRLAGKRGEWSRKKTRFSIPPGPDGNITSLGQYGQGERLLDSWKVSSGAYRLDKGSRFRSGFQESNPCRRVCTEEKDQEDRQHKGNFHKGLPTIAERRHFPFAIP